MFFKKNNCILIILLNFVLIISCAKYPSDLPKCKPDDDVCILKAAQQVYRKVIDGNGLQALGIPLIDPLHIDHIDIKQGSDSPVNVELKIKNADLIGLRHFEMTKLSGFGKEPNGKYEIKLKAPSLNIYGDYTIDGRVLILPIQGDGKCNLTLENPDVTMKFNGKSVTKNGKEYLQISNYRLSVETTRVWIYLGNLYKGDKALGDNTNLFLNENWQDIYNELKVNLFDAFGQIFEHILGSVFNRIPYKDLFAQD